MEYRVAAVQMTLVAENKEANIKKALQLYDKAVKDGAKVVCFPEYFLTAPPHSGMTNGYVKGMAETIPGPSIDIFREKAKATKTYCVAGTIIESCPDGKLRNTATLIGPEGQIIGKYSKTHPENAPAKHEPSRGITPGSDLPIFETELGKFAIMIDMDLTDPEVPRIYGLKGADVIFAPLCWSAKFILPIDLTARAAASYSHAYIVFSNPVGWRKDVPTHAWAFAGGSRNDLPYGGGSGIAFGPTTVAGALFFEESIAVTTIDTDNVKIARENDASIYPFWRRPDLYNSLSNPNTNQPHGTNFQHKLPVSID